MRKMFLTSAFSNVEKLFKGFADEDKTGEKVEIIPTAAKVERIDIHIKLAKEIYEKFGMEVKILELTEIDEKTAKERIKNTDYLHISGGNTFFLLQEIQKKNLIDFIVQRIENGMIYVGESAGTVITCPDIEYASLSDDKTLAPELKNTKGFGILPFYPLPHYGNKPFAESGYRTEEKYKDVLQLVPFSNNEVITVEGDEFEITTLHTL